MNLAVIIPIYKSTFYEYERISFQRCVDVLHKYPITVIAPEGLDLYELLINYPEIRIERFPEEYFASIQGYNRLMLSSFFYARFLETDYLLICQLDVFVFRDELEYWAQQGYDYIGAPWIATPRHYLIPRLNRGIRRSLTGKPNPRENIFYKVGNGGFSLRNTKKFYQIARDKSELITEFLTDKKDSLLAIEDVFWSIKIPELVPNFRIPSYKIAVGFAIDRKPDLALGINNNALPFACHGFNKPKVKTFWKAIFEKEYPQYLWEVELKNVLLDLRSLDNLSCGFGQIALNYGKLFGAMRYERLNFVLLVPDQYIGYFGKHVDYLPESSLTYKKLQTRFDAIHVAHQQSRFRRLPNHVATVFTIHDLNFLYEKSLLKMKKYLYKVQMLADSADVLVAISHFVANEAREHLDLKGKEIRVIYNGVERLDQRESVQPTATLGCDKPFFFSIGQIREKKNFHVLLDVMKHFPQHRLYIAGEAHRPYAQGIKQRILDEKIENVVLLGVVADAEKVWLYKNCEAFLFPSRFEGFGLPVIEAMQFGKAVFSSPMTSLTEVCGGHAFLWNKEFEPKAMARLIEEHLPGFYEDAERIEAIKQYAYSFSYERHVQEYLQLFKSSLGVED